MNLSFQGSNIGDPTATQHAEPAGVLAESFQTGLKSDSVGHRPVAYTSEPPVLSRQSFVQAELVSVPLQSVERGSSSKSQDDNEATESTGKDPAHPLEIGREPSAQVQEVGNETLEVSDLPMFKADNHLSEAPILIDSMPITPLEPHASDSEQLMDFMMGSSVQEASHHFNRVGSDPELTGNNLGETVATVIAISEEETTIMKETVVTEERQNMDEAEEGEIVLEAGQDTGPSVGTTTAEETMSETAKATEVAIGHRTRLQTGTVIRPSSGRGGTTINLADRAKERAALRQGQVERAPTSPGGRGRGRGGRSKVTCFCPFSYSYAL